MKKLAAGTVIIISIVVLTLVFLRNKDVKNQIERDFREAVGYSCNPPDHAEIIKEHQKKLKTWHLDIIKAKEKLSQLRLSQDSLKKELDWHEANLAAGWNTLKSATADPITIGGRVFSRKEIADDLCRRAVMCHKLRINFEALAGNCRVLEEAIKEAEVKFHEKEEPLESARMKQMVDKLINDDISIWCAKVIQIKEKSAALHRQRDSFKLELKGQEAVLLVSFNILKSTTADPITIGNWSFSRKEMNDDINRRIDFHKKIRDKLDLLNDDISIQDDIFFIQGNQYLDELRERLDNIKECQGSLSRPAAPAGNQ